MKLLYVNTHFAPDYQYGGVVESSSKIFKYLRRYSNIYVVAVSESPEKNREYIGENGTCFSSLIFHRYGFSLSLVMPLWSLIKKHDMICVNGIFTFPVTLAQMYCVLQKKKYVVSVRGGLEPWRLNQKKLKKKLFNKIITFPLLRKAAAIHVTSAQEEINLRNLGFSDLFLVSNGIDVEIFEEPPVSNNKKYFKNGDLVFLFLSRTDREKGLDILMEAFKMIKTQYNKENISLAIVGPDHNGYYSDLKKLYPDLNIIRISGVYGDQKYQIISESDCIVLPSYSENFGNIVAEGLAMGIPVITTTGTPWSDIESIKCGYYIKPTVNDLYDAMRRIIELTAEQRYKMGMNGRRYIFERYSWSAKCYEIFNNLDKIMNESK